MPNDQEHIDRVSIRPGPGVLSMLRHLNYRSWFALAEFVDNSLQSYISNKAQLEALHGAAWRLRVSIEIDPAAPASITIRDNAAGIGRAEFPRAFRPAVVPLDTTGLSEFGMGMKSAACWFASRWRVRTKALGEQFERTVRFDIAHIVRDELEELGIQESYAGSNTHFTEIVLDGLHHVPVGRTVGKIKEHLTDIYRVFIREDTLDLFFNGERLVYTEPRILQVSYVRDPDGPPRRWYKEIDFELGGGQAVRGFAALRDPGNHARSGFALFRRGRLIQGSGDEGYRPPLIFLQPGSYRYLRLFGELHLEGFEVSHTKDGFRWDENEQPFLELLKEELEDESLPILRQADLYRVLAARRDRAKAAQQALSRTAEAIEKGVPGVLPRIADAGTVGTPGAPLAEQPLLGRRELRFDFRGEPWLIRIELSDDPAEGQWLSITDLPRGNDNPQTIEIRIAMAHPFMVSFAQTNPDDIEALLRVGAALALSEKLARDAGVGLAGTVRRNVNDILRDALSRPMD